ncbi:major facilitator superfamily domain-containing protein 12-like [Acropora muricata]|uniref:major facilitator superfamily domain-containing protein 12-like n=1 Tax=Acropora muricata TaxID=159855 RepID=UPI0034E568CD
MATFDCFKGFLDKNSSRKRDKGKERLPLAQKFSHSVGHIFNDLAASAWFSYLIIFLTKIAGLSNASAGLVILLGQITDAIFTPINGFLNDRTVNRYGRRKIWHLIGTCCSTIAFPLLFSPCNGCEDSSKATKLVYYSSLGCLLQFGWGCVEISHLSLIPEISKLTNERVELNAIRSALTFLCGIFVYGVTWILLGQSSEKTISPNIRKQFMYLGIIVVSTGTLFNIIFHTGTKEPPSDALIKWQEERKLKKQGNKTNGRKALLKVDCVSSTSARRLSAQRVSTSVCKTAADKCCSDELISCDHSFDGSKLQRAELQDEPKDEIISRKACVVANQKTWKDWLKDPAFYKTGLVFTCSRLLINVSQSYFPLYLTETLKFQKEAIAYFPVVVLISGVFASAIVKPLNKRLGSKIAFSIGCLLALGACFWFYIQDVEGKTIVYVPAVMMGSGGSIMLVTSLSLLAELIGQDKKSGAFVYGSIGFVNKLSSGVIIAVIQEMNPRTEVTKACPSCDQFIRNVHSFVPGMVAFVALVSILLFFDSIFTCKRKVDKREIAVQTTFEEMLNEHSNKLNDIELCSEMNEDNGLMSTDSNAEDDIVSSESVKQSLCGVQQAMNNYTAFRLANPFMRSPMSERRTVP